MSEFLKGTFAVKKPVVEGPAGPGDKKRELAEKLKEQVLTSLGGSMVYMERTGLTWDGDKGDS